MLARHPSSLACMMARSAADNVRGRLARPSAVGGTEQNGVTENESSGGAVQGSPEVATQSDASLAETYKAEAEGEGVQRTAPFDPVAGGEEEPPPTADLAPLAVPNTPDQPITQQAASYADGVLTVSNAAGRSERLTFATSAALNFAVAPDNSGGTLVTESATVTPTITGTHASTDAAEAPVTPFAGPNVVVADPNGGATDTFNLATLERTFVIRAGEGFVGLFSAPLVAAVAGEAPGVCLRFVPKPAKEADPLRSGRIDLEIGTPGLPAPEVRTRSMFRDVFVGAVRAGHPLLAGEMTAERCAACRHVVVSRKDSVTGPVDEGLGQLGLYRMIAAVVPGYPDAMRTALLSDLVALVPRSCLESTLARTVPLVEGLVSFDLPVRTPEITVSAMWHPRMDADPAHRWLRDRVMATCRTATS